MERRRIGTTDIMVSPVAFGGWPITGITTLGTEKHESLASVRACLTSGINFFDTAFLYGAEGESERLIGQVVGPCRDEVVIATKGGAHWDAQKNQVYDASPARLHYECKESLRRLNTDYIDLLYLHAPDPKVPLAESAGAFDELRKQGYVRCVGGSNMSVPQLEEFHSVCPLSAHQPPYSMLQRQIEMDTLGWCVGREVSVMAYWPLMMGLLAGKLTAAHVFDDKDGRKKWPMFQGTEYRKNLDFVERLRVIAQDAGKTVAQLVINWTMHQPGITAALCGAKRANQVHENAGAMGWRMNDDQLLRIQRALAERGTPVVRKPSPSFSARADGSLSAEGEKAVSKNEVP